MKTRECKYCGRSAAHIRTDEKDSSRGWVYRDDQGRRWKRAMCPSCKRARDTAYARRNGHVAIDEVTAAGIRKGRRSERVALDFLRSHGYPGAALNTNGRGADIDLGNGETCEVKSAVRNGCGTAWSVNRVYPTRENDTFIIYVFPCGKCVLRKMHEHLEEQRRTKWGYVTVTQYLFPNRPRIRKGHGKKATFPRREPGRAKRPVLCITNGKVYRSLAAASAELDIPRSNLCRCVKGERRSVGGYRFRYANPEEIRG